MKSKNQMVVDRLYECLAQFDAETLRGMRLISMLVTMGMPRKSVVLPEPACRQATEANEKLRQLLVDIENEFTAQN